MRKLVLSFIIFSLSFSNVTAQKKEIAQARSYIKSGKNFDKAEKLMAELLEKDSLNRENPKIHVLLYEAVQRQYEAGNEKLYLGQKFDTAALFNLTKHMFDICQRFDSIDAQPDQKVADFLKDPQSLVIAAAVLTGVIIWAILHSVLPIRHLW